MRVFNRQIWTSKLNEKWNLFFSHGSYSTPSVPFFLDKQLFKRRKKYLCSPPRYWLLLCFYHTEPELGEKCFFFQILPKPTNVATKFVPLYRNYIWQHWDFVVLGILNICKPRRVLVEVAQSMLKFRNPVGWLTSPPSQT